MHGMTLAAYRPDSLRGWSLVLASNSDLVPLHLGAAAICAALIQAAGAAALLIGRGQKNDVRGNGLKAKSPA